MNVIKTLAAAAIGLGGLFGGQVSAEQTPAVIDAPVPLLQAARIDQLMQIVATEGARHGLGLEASLFPGRGGPAWELIVSHIQSPERMTKRLGQVLKSELSDDDAAAVAAYLSKGAGARIVAREVDTRLEMLDGAVEAEAKRVSTELRDANPEQAALIDALLNSLDLLGANVSGGLNANFAFYKGLDDGGALTGGLGEGEMLAMVWAQEESVRSATEEWLHGYLTRAYAPLAEDDLRDYLAFSATRAGKRYFAAMFAGFGAVFEETSYDLGLAAARFMTQDDA
ncbi:MAG: hypothetical protein AAF366_19775 [Pseudomonadota bacterium]